MSQEKIIMNTRTIGLMMVMMMMLVMPANALLTSNEGKPSFWSGLFGTQQSVMGQQLMYPGQVVSYKAMLQAGSPSTILCGNNNLVALKWKIEFVRSDGSISPADAVTLGEAVITEKDEFTSKLIVGAYYGEARVRWVKDGTYRIVVKYTCSKGTGASVEETLSNIRVAALGVCASISEPIGTRQCQSANGGVTVCELKLVNGCKVWQCGQACGDNQECGRSSTGVTTCIPKNQCQASTAECLSQTQYRVCEYAGALVWSTAKNVPYGYECIGNRLVYSPVQPKPDPCSIVSCNDANADTVDSCEASKCIFTPDCVEGNSWSEEQQACVSSSQQCDSKPKRPCAGATWSDSVCGWNTANCDAEWDKNTTFDDDKFFEDNVCEGIESDGKCVEVPSWVLSAVLGLVLLVAGGFGFFMFRRQQAK